MEPQLSSSPSCRTVGSTRALLDYLRGTPPDDTTVDGPEVMAIVDREVEAAMAADAVPGRAVAPGAAATRPKVAPRGQVRGKAPGPTPGMNPNCKSRHWCFTLNNPTDLEKDPDVLPENDYWIQGNEVGESGTPHLQGYICFKVRKNLSAVKKVFPRAHWEIMRGTPQEASDYCKKDGDFWFVGDLPDFGGASGGNAKKRNYEQIVERAKKGQLDEIAAEDPSAFLQHYRSIKEIRRDYMTVPPDLDDVCGWWFVGPPATGKSTTARRENPDFYDKPLNKWWDGYQGQKAAIIDDVGLEQGKWMGDLLKRWSDRFSFPAEKKGDTVQIRPHKIIVTSNYKIEEIFSDATLISALQRRFKVREFQKLMDVDNTGAPTVLLSDVLADRGVVTYQHLADLQDWDASTQHDDVEDTADEIVWTQTQEKKNFICIADSDSDIEL